MVIHTVKREKFFRLFTGLLLALLIVSSNAQAVQPPPNAELIELPEEAVQKLKIDAGFGWGIFSGTIYNGNNQYHITQLVVSMTPVHDHHHMHMHANMSHDAKVHRIDLDLPPLSKGALSMALPDDVAGVHDFNWEILKVTGYPVNK
ncbi:hypothetical protein R2083_09390 [Nitrosomonas sp. Is35]|uniref:hypothetical protein n=1 Tax=Nitrosomonas sp. Is35 TaxID=3080534 RepID=UPI00294B587A|nr:hypothetical protein [Nitrosomonas sp. Is35]MDV6347728.1 hypothetical protein [Nitrosomonas sp. Is35]